MYYLIYQLIKNIGVFYIFITFNLLIRFFYIQYNVYEIHVYFDLLPLIALSVLLIPVTTAGQVLVVT